MRCTTLLLGLVLAALAATVTRADPILASWNLLVAESIKTNAPTFNNFMGSRAMAAMHYAQWEAVKDVLATQGIMPGHMKMDEPSAVPMLRSAVAAAGQRVLNALMPASYHAAIDALYAAQVDPAQTAAIGMGVAEADKVLALRTGDGSGPTAMTNPWWIGVSTTSGMWRTTPALNQNAAMPGWANVKPWTMYAGSQFRVAPPPPLDSETYKRDYLEVMSIGSNTSTTRTMEQTNTAFFWSMNFALYAYDMGRDLTKYFGIAESARYMATVAVAFADAQIAGWDSKYYYSRWRPITAIRLGNDGIGSLPANASWWPLSETPNHPEYIAGHAATSAAVVQALTYLNGGDQLSPRLTVTSPMSATVTRSYASLATLATEVGRSRVFIGAHFAFSVAAGQTLGRAVGTNVVAALGLAGCGAGKFLWGSECVACPVNTYWASKMTFTSSCTACPGGMASPPGASGCTAYPSLVLTAGGVSATSTPPSGDMSSGGMPGMPGGGHRRKLAASPTLSRGKGGVIEIVQKNVDMMNPTPATTVVTLTLPRELKYAGTGKVRPPLVDAQKKPTTKAFSVNDRVVTWRWAPLAAGQQRVFDVKVQVHKMAPASVNVTVASFFLTPDLQTEFGRVEQTITVPIRS